MKSTCSPSTASCLLPTAPHLAPGIASESVTTFIGVSRRGHALGFVIPP
jgi:hypothetical protein